jgi:hypothetical protein
MAITDFERKYYTQEQMLVEPTLPSHFATKGYVDDLIAGLRWDPVRAVVSDNLAGSLDVTFKELTASQNGSLPAVDGVTLVAGNRILVVGQTNKTQNGIYVVNEAGSGGAPWQLVRDADADDASDFLPGKMVYVIEGDDFGGLNYRLVNNSVTLGTTDIEFEAWTVAGLEEVQAAISGDGALTEFTVSHTLNTKLVTVDAFEAGNGRPVTFAYEPDTVNSVKVMSGVPVPNGNSYVLLIRGRTQ